MAAIQLLTADALDLSIGTLLAPTWGVYLNGQPVIQPATQAGQIISAALAPVEAIASLIGAPNIVPVMASTIDFEYGQDRPISNYPQEQGAFQSYDKVTLPFDVKVRLACGGSVSNRQAFLTTCMAINASFALFDVVTPEYTYTSVNCHHMDFRRSARAGVTLLAIDLWFENVPVSAAAIFTNTQQPGNSARQSIGNVQPQSPAQSIQSSFDAFGAQ